MKSSLYRDIYIYIHVHDNLKKFCKLKWTQYLVALLTNIYHWQEITYNNCNKNMDEILKNKENI